MELLAVGFLIGFVKSFVPLGPTGLLFVERAIERRYREALAIGAGGAIVEAVYCLAAVLGARLVLARHPAGFAMFREIGIAVIGAAGAVLVFWPRLGQSPGPPTRQGGLRSLLVGVTTAVLNPAMLLTWSGVVGLLASQGLVVHGTLGLLFPAAVAAGTLTSNLVAVVLLRRLNGGISDRAQVRFLRGIGLMLIALAVWRGLRN